MLCGLALRREQGEQLYCLVMAGKQLWFLFMYPLCGLSVQASSQAVEMRAGKQLHRLALAMHQTGDIVALCSPALWPLCAG